MNVLLTFKHFIIMKSNKIYLVFLIFFLLIACIGMAFSQTINFIGGIKPSYKHVGIKHYHAPIGFIGAEYVKESNKVDVNIRLSTDYSGIDIYKHYDLVDSDFSIKIIGGMAFGISPLDKVDAYTLRNTLNVATSKVKALLKQEPNSDKLILETKRNPLALKAFIGAKATWGNYEIEYRVEGNLLMLGVNQLFTIKYVLEL